MINDDDIEKAKGNIDDLLKLRDELIKASPNFNEMKSRLNWYQEAGTQIPEQAENLYSLIEGPVHSILSLSPSNLDYSSVTGATGSFYSVSGDTRSIVQQYSGEHYKLIQAYDELNKTEELIDKVSIIIDDFRDELKTFKPKELLLEAKEAYAKWKAGAIGNYELAAAIRAFQDIFKGCLRDAWVKAANLKNPEFSWDKMSETLGKKGSGCKKSLLGVKGTERTYHDDFSAILKKTKTVSSTEMDTIFKGYIEHVYAIVNLVDLEIMN